MVTININGVEVAMPATARIDWQSLPQERLTAERLHFIWRRQPERAIFWSSDIEIDARETPISL